MQMNIPQKWITKITACAAALLLGLGGAAEHYALNLPDHFYKEADRPLTVATALPVTFRSKTPSVPHAQEAEARLFGMIPVKTVSLTTVAPADVYVGGEPFGIRMLMAGCMVVSMSSIPGLPDDVSPAADAGIAVGDIIQEVNGRRITGNADLQAAVSGSEGEAVSVTLLHGDAAETVSVQPVYSPLTKRWQTGMWVRDSTAGIGTVTYYMRTPAGKIRFAGLGHAVCDPDTGEQIPLASGDVIAVSVKDVRAGSAGRPGELRGSFETGDSIGTLLANTPSGVFGMMQALPQRQKRVPLGFRQDIRRGEAVIYTTVDGTQPHPYTVEIEEIRSADESLRDLVIHVTDPALLELTGGIVQGMSGSPIVQNGRLIGAVTHVFVQDPTRGYGIFAEHMYAQTAAFADAAGG